MFMCRVVSCVVGRGCLLWPGCSFGKTLLAFDLLCFVLQGQICLLLQVFLDFLLVYSSFIEPFNFSFFRITGQGIDLDYRDIELLALQSWGKVTLHRQPHGCAEIKYRTKCQRSYITGSGTSVWNIHQIWKTGLSSVSNSFHQAPKWSLVSLIPCYQKTMLVSLREKKKSLQVTKEQSWHMVPAGQMILVLIC